MGKQLKVVVLAKQVPDTRNVGKDAMKADGTVNRAALPAIFNPEDLNALEQALTIKDMCEGSTVYILTMGPLRAADIIRDAMFRGADGGYLLTDRAFAGADTLATSYALSRALAEIKPDIIVAGRQAIDGDTAQVGPQVAEKLGLPQVTYAEQIVSIDDSRIVIKRRLEHGVETVSSPYPMLMTVNGSAPECRPQNAKRVMKYKHARTRSELQELGEDYYMQLLEAKSYLKINEWNVGDIDAERGIPGQGVAQTDRFGRGYRFTDGRTYFQPHARIEEECKMNNVFVYIETEGGKVADVSLELLTKGRELADRLGCKLEALALGHELKEMDKIVGRYGADTLWLADDAELAPYRTLPHTAVVCGIFEEEKPQIALFGATPVGRDLAPRVSSTLRSGLTADCTSLVIGDHTDAKSGRSYENLLYQIRPAFGGNIIATIVNPDHRPQMATVREGVMRKEELKEPKHPEVKRVDVAKFVKESDLVVKIIDRHIEERGIDIKNAPVIVAGGYGMGSKENFAMLHELADLLGGEVGASRAAVDAGFTDHARQVGQTGVTVRPKLYIACGISGQIQHTAGMDQASIVIAINTDPEAPINKFADYVITGSALEVVPKMIKFYKQNSK